MSAVHSGLPKLSWSDADKIKQERLSQMLPGVRGNHELCVRLMSRDGKFVTEICRVCAEVCDWCADQCGAHDHQHCQKCADSCRKCADECRCMAGQAA